MPTRRRQQPSRSAVDAQQLPQPTAKQRRSALRSAANHHRQRVLRVLRHALLVVRFVVRLRRAREVALALREATSASRTDPGPLSWEVAAVIDLTRDKDKQGLILFSEQEDISAGAREMVTDALKAW